jgi:hypothetical protein
MERKLEIQWLLNHADVAKDVILAVLSKETLEDFQEMKALLGEGIKIAFDIMKEPAQALGVEIDVMRDLPSQEAEEIKAALLDIQQQDFE